MNPQRIAGIVLLVIGGVMLTVGIGGAGSAGSWYIVGGTVTGLLGLFLTIVSGWLKFTM